MKVEIGDVVYLSIISTDVYDLQKIKIVDTEPTGFNESFWVVKNIDTYFLDYNYPDKEFLANQYHMYPTFDRALEVFMNQTNFDRDDIIVALFTNRGAAGMRKVYKEKGIL